MDYSYSGGGAFAAVDVSEVHLAAVPYKISVVLDLPRDSYNQGLGNFMVRMTVVNSTLDEFLADNPFPELFGYEGTKIVNPTPPAAPAAANGPTVSSGGQWRLKEEHQLSGGYGYGRYTPPPSQKWPLTHSKKYIFDRLPGLVSSTKPSILPYKSPILEFLETFVFSPIYLTGIWEQKTIVPISMMDWPISATKTSKSVVVELDRTVNINKASLLWTVQWRGLRYFMYYHWIFMFIVGTGFFWFIETVAMLLVAWYIFHAYKNYEDELSDVEEFERIPSNIFTGQGEVRISEDMDTDPDFHPDSENDSEINRESRDEGEGDEELVEGGQETETDPETDHHSTGQETPIGLTANSHTNLSETERKIDTLLRHRAVKKKPSESSLNDGESLSKGHSSSSTVRPQLDLLDSLGPDPGPPTPAATPQSWDDEKSSILEPEPDRNVSEDTNYYDLDPLETMETYSHDNFEINQNASDSDPDPEHLNI